MQDAISHEILTASLLQRVTYKCIWYGSVAAATAHVAGCLEP
jgi:hypothetical protein